MTQNLHNGLGMDYASHAHQDAVAKMQKELNL